MREYPKIDNLYKRNPEKKSQLLVGKFTRPEFALIDAWDVTEKVDGTNVRLSFDKYGDYEFKGRTDNAQFTIGQENFLDDLCDEMRQAVVKTINSFGLDFLTVYGELYGPKIQSGGNYSDSLGFRAFDMLVNDRVWLAPDDVRKNTDAFGIEQVPNLGTMTTDSIFLMVAGGYKSTFAVNEDYNAEGVIAKPPWNLYDQRGERVMFKLKTCDLRHL
ncbi:RNA ligase [Streptomyces phage Faust]|uniref:RNA ligase n=1 Tax=Streptomyces phage Faust TaxID=2767565 RepID=A0A7G9UZ19_9CAUD|nr:RNA ligase [Streptomyces phage Faust]QNN99274.1 RNA ligase [Streptomyces phage Faust]